MYDKASIALIPSGTKTGKLYSVLPANDDGDFIFERGTTATRVNRDGLIETVASDVPRLDYPLTNGVVGDCPYLLLEPSRTNLITYSVDLASIFTFNIGGGSLTANYGVSPDGSKTSTRVITNDTNNSHCFEIISGGSGSLTYSLYYKGVIGETTTIKAITVGSGGVDAEKSITFTGKWQREQITFQRGASVNYVYIVDYRSINGTATDFQVFGGQLEEGSYATSYIPTIGLAETRIGDVCYNSGTSAEFNDNEGVLFAEIASLSDSESTVRSISISDSSSNNRVQIGYNSATKIRGQVRVGASNQASLFSTQTLSNFYKIALLYKENDFKLFVNGSEAATDTSGSVFSANTLVELAFDDGSGNRFYGKVKQLIYFNEALSDSELQTLTS